MSYSFKELVDLKAIQILTDQLYQISSIPSAIFSVNGQILTSSGWEQDFNKFHQSLLNTDNDCIESSTVPGISWDIDKTFVIYKCPHGLAKASAAIILDGEHVADVFVGQVFLEPFTDEKERLFREKAREYGFDKDTYIEKCHRVPVFTEEKFHSALVFLSELTEMIVKTGSARLKEKEAYAKLSLSDSEHDKLLKSVPDVVWRTDQYGNTLYISANVVDIIGYTDEEIIIEKSVDWVKNVHEEDVEQALTAFNNLIEKNIPFDVEYRYKHNNGTWIWLRDHSVTVNEENGIKIADGVISDITKQKQNEDTLRSNEKLLRTIAENFPNSYLSIIEKDFTIGFTSGQEFHKTGMDPDLFIGKRIEEVFGSQAKKIKKYYKKTFKGSEQTFELFINGQHQVYRTVPLKEENGKIERILAFTENVTEKKIAEERLRDSKQRMEDIFESSSDGIIFSDKFGNVLEVNDMFCEITNISKEDLIGKNAFFLAKRFLAGTSLSSILNIIKTNLAGSKTQYYELEFNDKILELNTRASKKRTGVTATMRDVTARKRAEEEIQKTNTYLSNLIDNTPGAIAVLDTNSIITRINRNFTELFGYTCEEAVGKSVNELIVPKDKISEAILLCDINELESRKNRGTETVRVHKSGRMVYVDIIGSAIHINNEFVGIYAIYQDITERKQQELLLRESEVKFRNVIEQSNDAIFILYNSRMDLVNKKFTELTGYTAKEVTDPEFNFDEILTAESQGLIRKHEQKYAEGEKTPDVIELTVIHKQGYKNLIQVSVSEIDYRDGVATLGIARDITSYRELEEQLRQAQKIESIGHLAGGIAHDFNNLLTPIIGNAEMAMMDMNPANPLYEDLRDICDTANRAAELTRQLLAFGRKQILRMQLIDLNILIKDLRKILRRTIREDITIKMNYHNSPCPVRIDPHQVEQVIINLFVNAQDAMPEGGIIFLETSLIELERNYPDTQLDLEPGKYAQITVTDTGEGIAKENLAKIFDPFFTTKDEGKGTGLGLSTTYGIIKQHSGSIWVHSDEGIGTIFKVYLPIAETDTDTDRKLEPYNENYHGTGTILIVEDQEQVRNVAERMLKIHKYNVLTAESADKAIALFTNDDLVVDMLLTDVIMPGKNGHELYQELKKIRPDLKVLYMSGYTQDIISHHGIMDSEINFIQKPLSIEGLLKKVRDVLRK